MEYKSLKQVYLDKTFGRKVPPLPRQQVIEQVLPGVESQIQPAGTYSLDNTGTQPQPPFPLNQVQELSWPASLKGVPFSIRNFNAHAGEGNGERRVAALFYSQEKRETDKNYTIRLGSYIGGQGESFDVITPHGNFEVKEFRLTKDGRYAGSVRIGAEGKHTTGNILSQIKRLLLLILENYASLDEDSKKVLNSNLVETIETQNNVPQEWSLEKYIEAIFDVNLGEDKGIQEFPKSLFNSSTINPGGFHRNPQRAAYLIYTIPQILNGLKQLALKDENKTNLDNEINRVQSLQSTLKNIYLKKEDEKLSKEIEKEAEVLDRRLISKACIAVKGSNCITLNTFLQKIEKANLVSIFADIAQLRQSEVTNLFPPEVKGFFAVFETKFKYIPRDKFINYLYIDSFTQKGLKIALRREAV